jgi:hypothetical protein
MDVAVYDVCSAPPLFGHGDQGERHESPLLGSCSHRHCAYSRRPVPVTVNLLLL